MPRASSLRAALPIAGVFLLMPSVAHASGGWEGVGLLIGLLAVPVLVITSVILGVSLALKKAQLFAGIAGLVLGVAGAVWQLFWFGLEGFKLGFCLAGFVFTAPVFLLSVMLLRAPRKVAVQS